MKTIILLTVCATGFLFSCSDNTTVIQKPVEIPPGHVKFLQHAKKVFRSSEENGHVDTKKTRIDTVLVLSSRQVEKLLIKKFDRGYKLRCKLDHKPYDPDLKKDSIARWLQRVNQLKSNDTAAYAVKFYIHNLTLKDGSKRGPDYYIQIFNKDYNAHPQLDYTLLFDEYFIEVYKRRRMIPGSRPDSPLRNSP